MMQLADISRFRAGGLWRILIAIVVLSAIPRPALLESSCLKYEVVSLTGRLVRQTYAGPPDFESLTKDEPQVIWVLLLDRYLCVVDPKPMSASEYNETEVQVVLPADQYSRYRHFVGGRVVATGELLPGGARYDKRLVLAASDIKTASVFP